MIVATILISFRIVTATNNDLANFAPIAAMLFCGAAFWKTNKWMLPAAIVTWLLSWPVVSMLQGYSPFHSANLVTIFSLIVVAFIGFKYSGKSVLNLIMGTLLAAIGFYFITNTVAFFTSPLYTKTLQGYIECMWTGFPAATVPTWVFFRNSLVANSLGTCLFLGIMCIPQIKTLTSFKIADQSAA